jgi:hypothetical protein
MEATAIARTDAGLAPYSKVVLKDPKSNNVEDLYGQDSGVI